MAANDNTRRPPRDLAYVEVASSELTRDINRDIVLERVRALQPVARVSLARASGLQPSTVSSIVEQLLEEGWIREGAVVKTARGRWPTMLTLNDDLVILVADIRPAQAILAVVDLNGRFLSREVVPLASDAEQGVRNIAAGLKRLRDHHPEKTFEGVGVSLPGRIDPESGKLILAPNLRWRDLDLRGALEAEMGIRPELENAANACLLSELWFGHMDGVRNAVLLTVSEGLGGSILADGRIVTGQRGTAGEFGHIPVTSDGPQCGCGAKGCWEVYASSNAALRYFAESETSAGVQPSRITIGELIRLAADGHASAQAALTRQAEELGRGLRIVQAAVAPEVVLFAGDITVSWEQSRPIIEREAASHLLAGQTVRLLPIGDGELARLRGAAAVVLQRHSGFYRFGHVGKRSNKKSGKPSTRGG